MPPEIGRMQRFVADLLARQGALVEPIEPEGLEVLAPLSVQQALGVAEFCRLGFGTSLPLGADRVGIESDWLDRFGRLLGERGRWARRVLAPDQRAPSDPERVLRRELVLDNATFRLLGVAPAWTRYLVLDFRFSAVSDEKRDGLVRLGVNLATGALPDAVLAQIAPWLAAEGPDPALPPGADLPTLWEPGRLVELVNEALPPRLDAALAPFVTGLRRRLGRDQDRLHAYHNDLHCETVRRAAALADDDAGRRREGQRIAAIAREYQAKLDDLSRQYALRVGVEWVQTLELAMPVQRFEVQVRRRKAERVIRLDWNPLARRLESPVCEFSRATERPRLACDDALHLVTAEGLAPCAGCGKAFCRACHRTRCPKCGSAVPRPGPDWTREPELRTVQKPASAAGHGAADPFADDPAPSHLADDMLLRTLAVRAREESAEAAAGGAQYGDPRFCSRSEAVEEDFELTSRKRVLRRSGCCSSARG